jgi:hypothetical protein
MPYFFIFLILVLAALRIFSKRKFTRFLQLLKEQYPETWHKHDALVPNDEFNPRRIRLYFLVGFNEFRLDDDGNDEIRQHYRHVQIIFWLQVTCFVLFLLFGFGGYEQL